MTAEKAVFPRNWLNSWFQTRQGQPCKTPLFSFVLSAVFPWMTYRQKPWTRRSRRILEIQGLSAYASLEAALYEHLVATEGVVGAAVAPGRSAASGASLCGSFLHPRGRFLTAPTSPTHSLWTTFHPLSPGLKLHFFHFFSPGLFPMLLTMPRTLALCSCQIWNCPHSFRRHESSLTPLHAHFPSVSAHQRFRGYYCWQFL